MSWTVNENRWPLLRVIWSGPTTDSEFREYLDMLSRNLKRTAAAQTRTAIVFDARKAQAMSSLQRKMQADWMKQNEAMNRKLGVGYAFVIDNPVVRGALTAILWITPMPAAHIVCKTVAEGESWAIDSLQAAGVVVPPALGSTG